MKLNLITLETVKQQLGISVTTYDDQINAMIPIVSADVRRILNTNYSDYESVTITSGSAEFITNTEYIMGQVLSGTGIPDDTYILSYDINTATYTMSANATAAGTLIYPTVLIAQWPTISKMIFYKIDKQDISSATDQQLKSVAYGPVKKEFSDSEINKKYDYPQIYIDDLGTPFARVG